MKKRKGNLRKRIFAALLAAVLAAGTAFNAAPVSVSAATESGTDMAEASSGDGWSWDGDGKLTITSDTGIAAWKNYIKDMEQVKSLEIQEGVTEIAEWAFSDCSSLTEINIPSSVTSVGMGVFYGCSSLTNVTIPETSRMMSIGSNVFSGCSSLTEINIPPRVTSIGGGVFYSCSSLTSITIPLGVDTIGESMFDGCNSLMRIEIPSSVTSIGSKAFSGCSSLTEIEIPSSVTSIGSNAFSGCQRLTSITIPQSVTSIESNTFSNCSSLTEIEIPSSVTSMGDNVFLGCRRLASVTMAAEEPPEENGPDHDTFLGWDYLYSIRELGLKCIFVPTGTVEVYKSAWQYYDDCITDATMYTVTVEGGVLDIDTNSDHLFDIVNYEEGAEVPIKANRPESGKEFVNWEVTSGSVTLANAESKETTFAMPAEAVIVKANYEDEDISIDSGEGWVFDRNGKLTITSNEGTTAWDKTKYQTQVKSVEIQDGVTDIGESAFSDCSNMTSITMPEGLTSIGKEALKGCSKLTSITLPDSLTDIGDSAFYGCSGITGITLPSGVTSIGKSVFDGCSGLTSITMPDSVTSIGESAFHKCSGLTGITLPDGVTSIGEKAFQDCSGLTSITLPDGVTDIGDSAFYGCSGLTGIAIPSGVTSIGKSVFDGCSGLTSITMPDSVTSIGDYAFHGCSDLTDIPLLDGVTSIGKYAFQDCSSLTSITIPEKVTSIGYAAFDYCTNLESVTMAGANPPSYEGITTFSSCKCVADGIKGIHVPEGTAVKYKTAWDVYADHITDGRDVPAYTVTVNGGTVTVSGGIVSGVTSAYNEVGTSVTITANEPENGKEFDKWEVTDGSVDLANATDKETTFIMPAEAVSVTATYKDKDTGDDPGTDPDFGWTLDGGKLTITSNSGTTAWRNKVSDITQVKSVEIQAGVTSIGDGAFRGCSSLESVTMAGENPPTLGDSVFSECPCAADGIEGIHVPEGTAGAYKTAWSDYADHITDGTDGKTSIPAGGKVPITGGKELTLPNGGTVDADGNVEAEKIVNGDTTVTAPEGEKLTADKDGNITVPAGGTVQTGDGEVTTLPNGGTVDKDGNINASPTKPFEGSGTEQDPYKISGKGDLEKLRDLVNGGEDYEGICFKVTADINLTGSDDNQWTPIGTEEAPFKGILDGDSHVISGLHINDSNKNNQGLFGTNEGTIKNLTVQGVVTGGDNTAGIAGTNKGTIENCTNEANVNGKDNVGGIAGTNSGTMESNDNRGTVTGNNNVGGIAGSNSENGRVISYTSSASNSGIVTGSGTDIGGIVGVNSGEINYYLNTAPVTGNGNVGGIVGTNGVNGTLIDCTNSGNVTKTGNGDGNAGAVVGNNLNNAPGAFRNDRYDRTDTVNVGLTGVGGVSPDPEGIIWIQGIQTDPKYPFEGAGTPADPYRIQSEDDLKKLADLVNNGEDQSNACYRIDAEPGITLTDKNKPWTPIGTADHPFTGTFDGNGKIISGLEINNTEDNQGLFGFNAGTIENLTVEGTVTGKDNVGGIAGTNMSNGTIQNCTNNADVTGQNNVGGIAGRNDGTIKGCQNNGTVTGSGNNAGGITGTNTGTVNGSSNTGSVNGKDNVGGIAGTNTGTVNGSDNTGSITGNDNVGGITGTNSGTVNRSDNAGAVSGRDNVGGITGNNSETGKVDNSKNTGTVTGNGTGTGGIAGTNDGALKNDTNTAPVTGKDDVGGITGTNGTGGTVEGCTNSGNVSKTEEGSGKPGAVIGNNLNENADAVKDDYYQTTDEINKGITGIGEGIGEGQDPEGITSGETPENPNKPKFPFEGMGTPEDPYRMKDKNDLENLRGLVNGGEDFEDIYFKITADTPIDLGGSAENPWTPIGTEDNPFKGTFDGDGHTITGLYIDQKDEDNQGLFGVNEGTIKNLTVEGIVTGKDNVGGIAGTNTGTGTIQNCTNNADVTGQNNVGGIAGKNDGTITGCQNNGTITGNGNNAGGITGSNTGTINESDNAGAVSGRDNVGGIAGSNTGTINGSDNAGSITGNDNVGGITGNNSGTVNGSGNKGAVTGNGTGAGGIAGRNDGALKNDTNTAPVTGKDDVGGIAGTNGTTGTIEGCTNSGNVSKTEGGSGKPGGVIGNNLNGDANAVKDDYYQTTDEINKGLTGIGKGKGEGQDPAGITSGKTPEKPGSNQAAADSAAAQNVVDKINAIGTVAKTDACAAKIKDARTAYDALTDAQKKLIPAAVLKKLTDAEAAYAALTKTSNLPPEKQQQIDNIAEKLGVSKETAQKIQALADELGVPVETLLLTDNSFADSKSEDDIKGSTFSLLQLKVTKIATKQVTLKWKKVKAADGYQIYGTRCGKGNKAKLITTITKNSKTSFVVKKLLKGKAYRYVVRAYKVIDGQKITIAASKTAHIFTNGGKYGNAKSVKVNKAKVQIKKGKTFKIKAKEVRANKPLRRHRKLCYESSNPDVATVTKKGVIKGKSKGTCTIYAYAQNGVFKKIKVTVK